MPDNCIGGDVQGGGGGNVMLLDNATGKPADNVIENQVPLTRVSQDRQTYQFSGLPEGTYQVKVTLDNAATQTSGPVGPGTTVPTFVF
jgi:hypothetical protein